MTNCSLCVEINLN